MKYYINTGYCNLKEILDFNSALEEFIKLKDGQLLIYSDDNSKLIQFDRHMKIEDLLHTFHYVNDYLSDEAKDKIWEVIELLKNELKEEQLKISRQLDEISK